MEIIQKAISELKAYENNPRKNDAVVPNMVRSIREFGFRIPVLAKSNGEVIDGHLRLKAAVQTGMESVPVILVDDLSEDQIKAFRICVNKSAAWAEWDEERLIKELEALSSANYDLTLTGFGSAELDSLLKLYEAVDDLDDFSVGEDEDIRDAETNAKHGDIWILGEHRLICGDCTEAHTVSALLRDEKPNLMVTDPPYGVNYDPSWRTETLNNGIVAKGKVTNDDNADWTDAWALFPGNVAYVWHAGLFCVQVAESLTVNGFSLIAQIIWAKSHFALSRGDYHWQHEACFYASRGSHAWQGLRNQSTLWNIAPTKDDNGLGHGTPKPIECMLRPILNNSQRGECVYEPFSGSGTTILACEKSGRRCRAVEIEPSYVDIAIKRWQSLTGKTAYEESSGRAFDNDK